MITRRFFDGGDDLQGAAVLGTLFNIDIEHPSEQPGPAYTSRRQVMGCVAVIIDRVIGVDRRAGNNLGTPLGVGREHAMEADQRQPRTGNQRGESLHKRRRRHNDVGRAISTGCLQRARKSNEHRTGPFDRTSYHQRNTIEQLINR